MVAWDGHCPVSKKLQTLGMTLQRMTSTAYGAVHGKSDITGCEVQGCTFELQLLLVALNVVCISEEGEPLPVSMSKLYSTHHFPSQSLQPFLRISPTGGQMFECLGVMLALWQGLVLDI
jgi:hypothetical protein